MFCNQCGKEIPNDSKFCPSCGTSIVNNQINDLQDLRDDNGSEHAMVIDDIFNIKGQVVLSGKVLCEKLQVGNRGTIESAGDVVADIVIKSIEHFGKLIDVAKKGDCVGVLIDKNVGDGIKKGQNLFIYK